MDSQDGLFLLEKLAGEAGDAVPQSIDGVVLDSRQRLVLTEWTRLKGAGRIPNRRHLRPERIAAALPSSMLLHVHRCEDGFSFEQRIEGQLVAVAFGEGNSRRIESIYTPDHLSHALPGFLEVATTGYPLATENATGLEDGSQFLYSRLILPFASADGCVARLLTVFSFDRGALARRQRPLPVRRSVHVREFLERLTA